MQGGDTLNPTQDACKAHHDDGRVLIVEDERLSRKALALLLGACGYETFAAGSAEEAVATTLRFGEEGLTTFAVGEESPDVRSSPFGTF